MNRRKLFKLIAGVVAAPRELLAAPVQSFTTKAIKHEATHFQFGFTGWKEMVTPPLGYVLEYPMTPDQCYFARGSVTIKAPRMIFELKGITVPEDDEVTT